MMSISEDDAKLCDAIKLGACGYILKEIHASQLHYLLMGWATVDIEANPCK